MRQSTSLIAAVFFCSATASAQDISKKAFGAVNIGMTVAQVETLLGRKGTNEGITYFVWEAANLRVAFNQDGSVAEFNLAKPGKPNALFDKFKSAFMATVAKHGRPMMTRKQIDEVVGSAGKKSKLVQFVWRNSNKAVAKVLVLDGKVRETAVSGRLK